MNLLTKVRKADENDLEGILGLVKDLAEYEKAPDAVTANLESYKINFKKGIFDAIVADNGDGQITGMVLYYYAWSTWKGKMIYLEDFVVKETVRGKGVGKLLFEALIEEAKRMDCVMLKWQVLDWNTPAIRFYEKYDTVFEKGWWNGKIYFKKNDLEIE